jgi:peptide/nickel transport system permease protein
VASTPETALPLAEASEEERVYIASQWKLIWWRFLRHRLALAGGVVVIMLYVMALFPEFLAIHDPLAQKATSAFIPPQRIHFFEGRRPVMPYVYGLVGERNPVTLAREWQADETQRFKIKYLVRGYEYKLFGLFTTNRHIIGLDTELVPAPLHPFGTDRLGRDQLSRLMVGTRISMSIGLISVMLSIFLGILLGGLSGLRGGVTDIIIQRVIEFLRAIPTIPLWLTLAAALPTEWSPIRVFFAITIIISLIGWTQLAREVRGRFLAMRDEDFVIAARLYGSSQLRLIFRHMLPSFMSHVIAATSLSIPGIIVAETSLSFLGLGIQQPAISWGVLLSEAQNLTAVAKASWLMLPGLFVLVAILAFNFVGDGLRDAADPYAVKKG